MTPSPNLRFLHPEALAKVPGYTPVVEVRGGRTVYVSGQIALDASGQVVGVGDFKAQARQTFENMRLALAAAGMDFGHVVKFGLYLTDVSNLAALRRVRDEFINTQQPPASTLLEVSAFFHPDILFEADAIAAAPD